MEFEGSILQYLVTLSISVSENLRAEYDASKCYGVVMVSCGDIKIMETIYSSTKAQELLLSPMLSPMPLLTSSSVEATDVQPLSTSRFFSHSADPHNHEAYGETRPDSFELNEEAKAALQTEQADKSNHCFDTPLEETTNTSTTHNVSELEQSELPSEVTAGSEAPVKKLSTAVTSATSKPQTTMSKTPGASPAKKVSC